MKVIVLIACSSTIAVAPCAAQDIYVSPLFRLSLAYAKKLKPDATYILSALHGLLALDTVIAPYNLTLNTMDAPAIATWSGMVLGQLQQVSDPPEDTYVFLAGKKYCDFLVPNLNTYQLPLKHLTIARRLAFLKANT
jgi:hypothetical protein